MCWIENLWNGLFYPQKKNPRLAQACQCGLFTQTRFSEGAKLLLRAPTLAHGASAPTMSLVPTPPPTNANNIVINTREKLDPNIIYFT